MHYMPMMNHDPISLGAALLIGLLGAGHCLGMCGGIINALSMATAGHKRFRLLLGYNLGRLTSYTFIGLLVGLLGSGLAHQSHGAFVMRTIAALVLVLAGLYIGQFWNGLLKLESLGKGVWKYIQPFAQGLMPVKNMWGAMLLGALWGWLPCGLIYSTAIWASMAGSPLMSAGLMLSFGVGTLPAILATGLTAQKLASVINNKGFKRFSGVMLIIYGVWTLPFVGMPIAMAVKRAWS
jgi:sulfite exporter TauE/SafE